MKKLNIVLAFAMLIASQVSGQRIFNNVALANNGKQGILTFSLPSEANIIHYRIEASNDNINFEVLGTIASKGNSVMEKTYSYKLYNMGYKFYRVGRVGMNGSLQYSHVISLPEQNINTNPGIKQVPAVTNAIANY